MTSLLIHYHFKVNLKLRLRFGVGITQKNYKKKKEIEHKHKIHEPIYCSKELYDILMSEFKKKLRWI